jgi:hypothetical protein
MSKTLWKALLLVILVGLAVVANQIHNPTAALVLVGVSLGIATNFLTELTTLTVAALSSRLSTSQQTAKAILEEIQKELIEIDLLPIETGRFRYGYEHVIYSPKSMKRVDEYVMRFRKSLIESSVDDTSPYEAALLALFAGYNSKIVDCLHKKFSDFSIPEFTRLADKAGSNILFQQIVLTLALGKYFPGRAHQVVEQIYKKRHKTYYGDWVAPSRDSFRKVLLYANDDDVIITYHIGNAYRPLDLFSRMENRMRRIHFYFIHPCLLSRRALLLLGAELDGPAILKNEVGFLRTAGDDYHIDFMRKVFQLLSNVHEIMELRSRLPDQKIQVFFYVSEIPSVCVQIVRNLGYIFLMPAAFDNSKFLCRFTIEIHSKEIVEQFVALVDQAALEKQRLYDCVEKQSLPDWNYQRLGDKIETLELTRESLNSLCAEALGELVVYLKAAKIGKSDVEIIGPELMSKVSGDANFNKAMYIQLLALYS